MIPRWAFIFSICLHIAIVLLVSYWGLWGRHREFEMPPPIVVELAEMSEITQTTRVSPVPVAPEEKEKPVPESASQKPPKVDAQQPPDMSNQPEPEDAVPLPPDPKEEKKPEEKKPVKKPPVPKPRPQPPKPEEKKEEKSDPFASVLRNLAGEENPQAPANEQPDVNSGETPAPGQMAPLGEKLTISEQDALRRQLESCWNVPIGARDAENLVIELRLFVNPDRTLRQASIVDQRRYNQDDFFRAAADSAMRAVRHPNCTPLALPPDKYKQWQSIVVTFNPKEMF